ncbi:MAG TPA: hypothetical protein ENH19_02045 [Actinobacteria bacterium]|nr:hypothetical protein [Actinomycetes bacterium]HEX21418.1 hypothetical protein [Actinomycetota bacterium]
MKTIRFKQQRVPSILDGSTTVFRRPINGDIAANFDWDINDKDYIYYEDDYGDSHHAKELSKYQVGDIVEIMTNKKTGILLKITDVRVERLYPINYGELLKEGAPNRNKKQPNALINAVKWFEKHWNEIYEDKGYEVKTNPWVFVYEFEVLSETTTAAD